MSATAPGLDARSRFLPFWTLLAAIVSVQFGATWAKKLFPVLGPVRTTALRLAIAAMLVLACQRPWRHVSFGRRSLALLAGYGLAMAGMNLTFYLAVQRIPLGIAVALEFLGPLTLAILLSHRVLDLLWAGMAALGVWLLLPLRPSAQPLDHTGVMLALVTAVCWASYTLVGQRAGRELGESMTGLGMAVAALLVLPVALAQPGHVAFTPGLALPVLAVAVLSSALPYPLEMIAITRLPTRVYGTLTSLEPAVGALMGLLFLAEIPSTAEMAGMGAIIAASAGAALTMGRRNTVGEP